MFKILNKNINKFILLIPTLLLAKPAFADGGIPLWIGTAASVLSIPVLSGRFFIGNLISGIIALFMVSALEAICVDPIFDKRRFKDLFKLMLKANFYSTIIGLLILILPILIPQYKYDVAVMALGPWSFTIIIMFIESCIVEFFVVKKDLIKDYSTKTIAITIIFVNLFSYIVMSMLLFFFIVCRFIWV